MSLSSSSKFPTLETERLVLRELREGDVADFHRMFSDPEVLRYLGRPAASLEDAREFVHNNWGQGVMSEALRAILHFGFTTMGLHSTEAQTDPENRRSRRVLERLGFRQDGLLRENFFHAGRYHDTVVFTLVDREFLAAGSRP